MYPLYLLYFVLGACIGSFLNVCIYRIPAEMSVVSPPSRCGSCGHRLGPLDMIPILSYFLLRGHCRYCGESYSCRYAMVELLTGLLFVSCGMCYLPGVTLVLAWVFVSCLVIQTFVDWDHQIILDVVLLFMIPFGMAYAWFGLHDWMDAAFGFALGGGLMGLIYLLSRGGMGLGDVKLAAVMGLWLGLQGTIVALFLAFLVGGVVGVLLLVTGVKSRKDAIPFGPYLCLGAYVALLFGSRLVFWYWSLFI